MSTFKKKKKKCYSVFSIMLIAIVILLQFIPLVSYAQNASKKTIVRIPCGINNSLYLDKNNNMQGECAKYLEALAEINNWEYEFVRGTWSESYKRFLDGDIDILFPTQKSEAREKLMDFSSLIGGYQLVAMYAKDDKQYCYEDFQSFNNKKIAVSFNSANESVLKNYSIENGFTYTPVYIESTADKIAALNSGEVDLATFSTLNSSDALSMVATLDAVPFYYATKKDDDILLKNLNKGMKTLLVQQPELVEEIFSETSLSDCNIAYTKEESECIKKSEKVVVGFYDDTAPLCEIDDNGSYQGIYIELLNILSKTSGLNIELHPVERKQYGIDLVREGTIDFIMGSSDSAFKLMNMADLMETSAIVDYNTVAVTKQKFQISDNDAPRFALTSARRYWENYIYSKYPNATVAYYESAKDCLNAVSSGKSDATLLNTIEYNYQSKNPRYSQLIEWESFRMKSSTVMVCSANVDPYLLAVINKTFQRIEASKKEDIINYYLNTPYHSYSFEDIVYNARIPSIIIAIVVFIAALIAFIIIRIRKKSYSLLEEKNMELIKANAAKTDFLSRMSHDMRTPMNGILGMTTLMKDKTNLDEIKEDLTLVEYSGKYLLSLINDTLDMNKIESGKLELHPEPANSEELFRNVLTNAQILAKEKGVLMKITTPKIPHDKWVPVIADVSRVQQVMINLISNAVKYTPEGGQIELIMETVSITDEIVTDRYIIRDNGIGMSEEFLPHLYESFTQEGRIGIDRQTGTGLGMAIVKQLVDLMDGSISVKSIINQGTEFTLVLHYPIYHGKSKIATKASYSEDILKGKRILLCEDHPLNTKIAVQLLAKKGILVDTAPNGKIGVQMLLESPKSYYDLILMDIRMPIMDGIEAAKEIRSLSHPDGASIPIIAMTANAFDEDRERTKESGMNAHLSKPIVPELLYQTICKYITENK